MSWLETFAFACPLCRGHVEAIQGDAARIGAVSPLLHAVAYRGIGR